MIVGVKYQKKDGSGYGGKAYSYRCDIPDIKVGDIVSVPAGTGDTVAQIVEINVPEASIPENVRRILRTVTGLAKPEDTDTDQQTIFQMGAEESPSEAFHADGTKNPVEAGCERVLSAIAATTEAPYADQIVMIKQLPVISDRLHEVKSKVEARVEGVMNMACTEDNYKEVKRVLADLRSEHEALEQRRIAVKRQIMRPVDEFEQIFKKCVSEPYKSAELVLSGKVNEVTDGIKAKKENEIKAFFLEYRSSIGLDDTYAPWEGSGIKIGMSDSVKSLQQSVLKYLDGIADDLAMISSYPEGDKDDILYEYKNSHSVSKAVMTVNQRKAQIEEQKKRRAEEEQRRAEADAAARRTAAAIAAQESKAVDKVMAEAAAKSPEPMQPAKETVRSATVAFAVTAPVEKLKELKQFLVNGGYGFKSLKLDSDGGYRA